MNSCYNTARLYSRYNSAYFNVLWCERIRDEWSQYSLSGSSSADVAPRYTASQPLTSRALQRESPSCSWSRHAGWAASSTPSRPIVVQFQGRRTTLRCSDRDIWIGYLTTTKHSITVHFLLSHQPTATLPHTATLIHLIIPWNIPSCNSTSTCETIFHQLVLSHRIITDINTELKTMYSWP